MKKLMLTLAALPTALFLSSPAKADGFTQRELTFQALNLIDAAQTVSCLDRNVCREGNPLFGGHPSSGKALGIKAGFGALHFVVARLLDNHNPRTAKFFQIATIAVQGGVVAANLRFTF